LSFENLASLTISIWAGDATMYSRLHDRNIESFYKVKNNLEFLNLLKPSRLYVKVYAIINNINYLGTRNLLDLVTETGCNAIEFGVADVIPQATDSFLLNEEQLSSLKQDFNNLLKQLNKKSYKVRIINKNIFLKRISSQKACFGEYDSFVDRIPCYAGWVFLRLRANGDFNSCLKSHRIPIGNIYKDSFSSVWNGSLQQEFREKSLNLHRDKDYFRYIGNGNDGIIGCRRVCDNILMNEHLHKIIRYLFCIR
jgi:MoaA/NifB/PqqE/SkfB family radical SAM enzyme